MNYRIAVIKGDGIGPEVISQAMAVLEKIGERFGHTFTFKEALAGGHAIEETGECLPQETLDICRASHAVLLGAVGGPKWDDLPGNERPEAALFGLRKSLDLFCNLRPAIVFEPIASASPLKADVIGEGLDLLIVRELTGGIYFGDRGTRETELGHSAYDVEIYSEMEIERVARCAFEMAMKRNRKVTSVDKANVMESSRLWREIVAKVSIDYPDVELNDMLVDNAAMQLILDPKQFDVILTNNIFGDILSDEAGQITGSIGMLPSASMGTGNFGMYEPVHGSAPDIAGKDLANPVAAILSAALLLKHSFGLNKEADAINKAVINVLRQGFRTPDLCRKDTPGVKKIGTRECGELIIKAL